ncbi:ATPase, P-type (transporting), HAD superfamily, subfamily IC [Chloroherpeton thalassium ATCC 35110]|uniref:ATPase, P-type (Transporting), HAD superfamily, subfamily IC n=1 Tax=Chloroherpeton thalassium (strain ATCC 35110 / GB-78) TaxID=517418 RepID=B3QYP5_CHLT3|nr:HAD-IC family P-type ATPase [Chloroherpeton thalassium]ACF15118.1 ATPase, P-type (transporting), HAD superfamily, subfamily IC [Chloroherpeton thalassium ATCC 35110]
MINKDDLKIKGLSSSEVNERVQKGLTNHVKNTHVKSKSEIFFSNAFNVFNIINLTVISFLLYFYFKTQDVRLFLDSIGIITVTFANTLIAIVQELKAANTLEKMDLLKHQEVFVIRNGEKIKVPKHDVVKDDVILLKTGDQIVVDGKVLASERLEIDESLVTGESIPIDKSTGDKLLSGSFCVYGQGYYKAEKVGNESFAAHLTGQAKKFKFSTSPLQKKINFLFVLSFVLTVLMVFYEFFQSLLSGHFSIEDARKISTIATSLIPEGLVFFSSITFTIGIIRIAKIGAVIQKINAIDTFPAINVVCMDKTGTLTQNNIKVASVHSVSELSQEAIEKLLGEFSHLSSEQNATLKALTVFPASGKAKSLDEIPFRSDIKMSALKLELNGNAETYLLGAYDILTKKTDVEKILRVQTVFETNQLKGRRNLLFAKLKTPIEGNLSIETIADAPLIPLGIISLKDEARQDAGTALHLFNANNIDVKIISGDSGDSVLATLHEIGWDVTEDKVISGKALEGLSQPALEESVLHHSVFVRLKPDQKLALVKALKHQHKQTAMIGDGVNDLLALKEANLGIAMEEGSTISKEVSDIVLLKNKFEILPRIFDEGNKIVNTVMYVSNLFLSKNALVVVLSILPWILNVIYPLTPRKGALISLLGIGLPAYFIALQNENTNPQKHFYRQLVWFVMTSCAVILGVTYLGYFLGHDIYQLGEVVVSNIMITVLVLMSVGNYIGAVAFEDIKIFGSIFYMQQLLF